MQTRSPGGRTDQASRTIRAPASTIYRAFASARAMESWLPPTGMTGHMLAFDFRDGGSYRMRLTYVDPGNHRGKSSADADDVAVRFVALVEHRRIEQAVTFDSADPDFAGTMTIIWTLEPVHGGTEVTVRCENVPRGIRRDEHEAGLASTLENLARFTEE